MRRFPRRDIARSSRPASRSPVEMLEERTLFAAGDLDLRFGRGDGIVTTNVTASDSGNSVVIQADQKIVVGGTTGDAAGAGSDFALVRYTSAGALDTTFGGGDGIVTTDFGGLDSVEAVALAPGNKVVAVGYTGSGTARDWAVARYNADGSLDTTFGTGGKVTTDFFFGSDTASGVTVLPDGRIMVVGVATGATTQAAVVRYAVNGDLDPTFDGDGQAFVDYFGGADAATAVQYQPADNKIVVAGASAPAGSYRRFVLLRFDFNGALDPTFGDLGKTTADFGGAAVAKDLLIEPSGKYVLGGVVDAPGGVAEDDFAVARFNADGTLDTTFGAGGRTTVTGFAGSQGAHYGLARQGDGKLLLGGLLDVTAPAGHYFGAARFNPGGTLDATFGSGGTVRIDPSDTRASDGADLALQNDGKIIMAGTATSATTGPDFAVLRLLNNVSQPASISGTVYDDANGNGVRDVGEPGLSGWTVYQDVNGNGQLDASANSFSSTDVPKPIPDNNTPITSDLTVAGMIGEVLDVNVTLSIQHTYDPDLVLTLVSPAGTRVQLANMAGNVGTGSRANFDGTIFDDQATVDIGAGRAPFVGSYKPQQPLSTFIGQQPNGVWKLEAVDTAAEDVGTILNWSLAMTTRGEPSVVTGADGSYAFTGIAAGNYTIRQVAQSGFLQTAPIANNGAYVLNVVEGQAVTGQDFGNTQATTAIVGRWVFYNNSAFDGRNPAINSATDAAAIDTSKQALLPGQAATGANVTTYSRGINGIMVDIRRVTGTPLITYRVGNGGDPSTWTTAPQPVTTNLSNTDVPGLPPQSVRVTAVWADGAIKNQWLQVTVGQSAGLEHSDVFYFGNLIGESDSPLTSAGARSVSYRDLTVAARNSPATSVPVTNRYDHNKDGRVNALDLAVIHRNLGRSLAAFTAPATPAGAALFAEAPVIAAAGLRTADDRPAALLA